ncbi:MAG: AraC family transcriptional regulator [Cellulosilyticaceae bacterium]
MNKMDFREKNKNNVDINISTCGFEKCNPKLVYGPRVIDHYLIHYVVKGKGKFCINGVTYEIKKGQGFLIPPDVLGDYGPSDDEPWEYFWVGFNGAKASQYIAQAHLSVNQPVFSYTGDERLKQCMQEMVECTRLTYNKQLRVLTKLYEFICLMIENNTLGKEDTLLVAPTVQDYALEAVEYIENNFFRNITINDIAKYLNLNRSYLYKLFKSYSGISPQQFLINYRMERACELLGSTQLTITQVAASVGYTDSLVFSNRFKKYKGMSPTEYRTYRQENKI